MTRLTKVLFQSGLVFSVLGTGIPASASTNTAVLSTELAQGPVRVVDGDCTADGIRADLSSVDLWRRMLPADVGDSLDGSLRVVPQTDGSFRVLPGIKDRPDVLELVCVPSGNTVSCGLDPRNFLKNHLVATKAGVQSLQIALSRSEAEGVCHEQLGFQSKVTEESLRLAGEKLEVENADNLPLAQLVSLILKGIRTRYSAGGE